MPSAPSSHFGLTSPLSTEAPNGAANIATLIAQLEASIGMGLLASVASVGGAGAGITFSSIPQTFKHLRLVGIVRSGASLVNDDLYLRVNGNSGANYHWISSDSGLSGTNPDVNGGGINRRYATNDTKAILGTLADSNAASKSTALVLDMPDYTNAALMKVWSGRLTANGLIAGSFSGSTGTGLVAAVTSLTLANLVGGNGLASISSVSLYGLR